MASGKANVRISKKLHTHSLHPVRMGGVFWVFCIDEVNSKQCASVMDKSAKKRSSTNVELLFYSLEMFIIRSFASR